VSILLLVSLSLCITKLPDSVAESFLSEAIPMKGRMIHHVDGKQESQIYDPIGGQVSERLFRRVPADGSVSIRSVDPF
jgi:hypothetical protein